MLAVCNEAVDPGHRGRGPQRRVRRVGARCTAAWCSTSAASRASSTSTRRRSCSTSRPGTFGDHLEHELRARARPHARPLAAVGRALDGRRLAGVPLGRPALDPLREDRGHGARPRRGPRRRPAHHHRRRAAGGGRPRPQPALRRLRGHARHHHRRPAPAAPGARRTSGGAPTRSRRSTTGSTPCGASSSAAARPPCCASTTPSRPTAPTRPATARCSSCSTRARAPPSTPRWSWWPRCAGRPSRADPEHVGHWLEHRNDVAALEALISRGLRRRHDGGRRPLARPAGDLRRTTVAALQAVEGTLAASAHQSHSYTDGGCLYFTFAAKTEPDDRDRYYREAWDAGTRAVLAAGGALSHHHGVGLNRSRFVAEALGPAFDVLAADEGRARPERHPQPRQARASRPPSDRPGY